MAVPTLITPPTSLADLITRHTLLSLRTLSIPHSWLKKVPEAMAGVPQLICFSVG
jgi:hypothetical protein